LSGLVFLDRDGTIIVERDYLSDPDLVELERGAVAGLSRLIAAGYTLVVLTNQSGIARGYFDLAAAERVNARVAQLLGESGIAVAGWYICPHGEADGCDCRKPAPGLAHAAARDLELDIAGAWIVGDKLSDAGMAPAFAGRGILVTTGHGARAAAAARAAGIPVVADLNGAADLILAAQL
jgi:histidinol-phosphate phosphatase family protein